MPSQGSGDSMLEPDEVDEPVAAIASSSSRSSGTIGKRPAAAQSSTGPWPKTALSSLSALPNAQRVADRERERERASSPL